MNEKNQNPTGLGALQPSLKTGQEPFTNDGRAIGWELADFWRWYASDLVGNALRGCLAEFIVAKALGCGEDVRTEWDCCDIRTPEGLKMEVKSAAYIQSWSQARPSLITFGIAPTKGWDSQTNVYSSEARRHADVYVFCLLKHQDQANINPLELAQWEFIVVATSVLNTKVPDQKKVSLSSLLKLEHRKVSFEGLAEAVRCVAGEKGNHFS